jgi:Tfp pilus assembly protein PilZ
MNTSMEETIDKRAEFRFPVVIPVEYFNNGDFGIVSYAVDISKNGAFISSDDPVDIGKSIDMKFTIPVNDNASHIVNTEGNVAWQRVQPFKSPKNGMGIHFSKPISGALLLNALSSNVRRLVKERDAKKELEEHLERLESELEDLQRLADVGRCSEKLLHNISNPLISMSGRFELIRDRVRNAITVIEEKCTKDNTGLKNIKTDCEMCLNDISSILHDYNSISELIRTTGDDMKNLEDELKRYENYNNA